MIFIKIIDTYKYKHKGENVKITKLSLAAIAAMTITTGAMASGDASEWDFSGQAVVFTQTADGFGGSVSISLI